MFEQLAIEQTPVAVQIYTQNYFEGPKTANPTHDRRAPTIASTKPRVLEIPVAQKSVTRTSTLADLSERRHPGGFANAPVSVDRESVIEKTRNDRVTLLAQKYAGKIDSEANARLEILTARLSQLAPVVDAGTLDKVAEVVEVAQRVSPRISALKSKYKI